MSVFSRIINWVSFPYSLYLLLKAPGVSSTVKLKAGVILGAFFLYLLSPADLIPDFIPALGWLDDLLALPITALVIEKAVPEINLSELKQKAQADVRKIVTYVILVVIAMALISLVSLGILIYGLIRIWS